MSRDLPMSQHTMPREQNHMTHASQSSAMEPEWVKRSPVDSCLRFVAPLARCSPQQEPLKPLPFSLLPLLLSRLLS